jgi:hypothetical protein
MRLKGWKPFQRVEMKRAPLFLGYADENGELEITDEEAIRRALERGYQIVEPPAEAAEESPSEKVYTCKHCGAEFINKGDFLVHCRVEHPKPKKEAEKDSE